MEDHNSSSLPFHHWSLLHSAVKSCVKFVYDCDVSIQGHDTLLAEQNERMKRLTIDINYLVSIEDPLSVTDLLTTVIRHKISGHINSNTETYVVRKDSVISSLDYSSMRAADDLNELTNEGRSNVEMLVANIFLHLFVIDMHFKYKGCLVTAQFNESFVQFSRCRFMIGPQ